MKIKVIDFGYTNLPKRAHENDAGADVYAKLPDEGLLIEPHTTAKIPLGFGLELPDGYMACVYPRSSLSARGIVCELPPIDSGYRGEVHAIVSNLGQESILITDGERIGQLVVTPVVIADFVTERGAQRGNGAFGSTGLH